MWPKRAPWFASRRPGADFSAEFIFGLAVSSSPLPSPLALSETKMAGTNSSAARFAARVVAHEYHCRFSRAVVFR
jgi:hypothetical protein